ncbi:MAG: septum formation initiator family protein [Bauldia sp.]|uniref:FtsB family cell division protein n=1 Tax=Bauldia sp. TaxID=2575872 RepID=UPI001D361AF8|nr:septum formation initiator family protein [Bauldia sp.]MCB1497081.1 septum formation initiator family protein [Bauldia sp.]
MITRHRRRSPFRLLWLPLTTAAFVGYFGYHAYNGSYGVPALEQMQVEARDLKASLEDLRDERAALEKRVSYLKPDSLDADILDIEARTSLNLLRPDEVVISFGAVQHSREDTYD